MRDGFNQILGCVHVQWGNTALISDGNCRKWSKSGFKRHYLQIFQQLMFLWRAVQCSVALTLNWLRLYDIVFMCAQLLRALLMKTTCTFSGHCLWSKERTNAYTEPRPRSTLRKVGPWTCVISKLTTSWEWPRNWTLLVMYSASVQELFLVLQYIVVVWMWMSCLASQQPCCLVLFVCEVPGVPGCHWDAVIWWTAGPLSLLPAVALYCLFVLVWSIDNCSWVVQALCSCVLLLLYS